MLSHLQILLVKSDFKWLEELTSIDIYYVIWQINTLAFKNIGLSVNNEMGEILKEMLEENMMKQMKIWDYKPYNTSSILWTESMCRVIFVLFNVLSWMWRC